jgi:hypothetical protein
LIVLTYQVWIDLQGTYWITGITTKWLSLICTLIFKVIWSAVNKFIDDAANRPDVNGLIIHLLSKNNFRSSIVTRLNYSSQFSRLNFVFSILRNLSLDCRFFILKCWIKCIVQILWNFISVTLFLLYLNKWHRSWHSKITNFNFTVRSY